MAQRDAGRYVSSAGMRLIRGSPADPYQLIVVDRQGLPVAPLTIWYRLRAQPGPNRTRDTYLRYLLPVWAFFAERGWAWDAAPCEVQRYLVTFHQERLACLVSPDSALDGYTVATTRETPLCASTLRGVRAALRDFYGTMREARLYAYANPLDSAILTRLKREHLRALANGGAPDHAGIRGESRVRSFRRPTSIFRDRHPRPWSPDARLGTPAILQGLQRALAAMLAHPHLTLRDRAILLLLRYTGARVHEIVGLSVGGYRSFTPHGILGQAYVADKGSGGQEIKRIDFSAAPEVQRVLIRYLRQERAQHDPLGRSRLDALRDDDPLFLTARGTPYTYTAFRWHWRRLYRQVRTSCPIPFAIHHIRHLHVTELLLLARARYGPGSPRYADQKLAIARLMGWQSPQTIDTYDHTLDEIEALGLLADLQRALASGNNGVGVVMLRSDESLEHQAGASQHDEAGQHDSTAEEEDAAVEAAALAWVERHVHRRRDARQGDGHDTI